jgi:hypothetical protein
MTTIVNNPPSSDSGGNGMGFLIGIVLLIVMIFLVINYGVPYVRGSVGSNSPQINVPGKVDVNIRQNK